MRKREFPMKVMIAIATASMLFLSACGEIGDARYDKWRRYTDQADGYVILIPPTWSAEDEVVPGYRGTRFVPTDTYTGDIAAFVYYAVMVKDLENTDVDFAQFCEATIQDLLRGIWNDLRLESSAGQFGGKPAMIYEMYGKPLYTEYALRGQTCAVSHNGKLYLFMTSATDGSYEGLGEEFELMRNSLRFE